MMGTTHTVPTSEAKPAQAAVTAAFAGLALGALVVFTVGFSLPEMIHNAAHDTRHATGFPCH